MLDTITITKLLAASKAGIFILGIISVFTGVILLIAGACRLVVYGLQVINTSVIEAIRLYSLQVPLVQMIFLLMLCCGVSWLIMRSLHFLRCELEFREISRLAEALYIEVLAQEWRNHYV